MNTDDEKLLTEEMADVTPLKKNAPITRHEGDLSPSLAQQAAREAAVEDKTKNLNPLSDSNIRQVNPYDILEYIKPGVQEGVYRKLRLGKYPIQSRLDLHQKTIEDARGDVFQFIQDCVKNDLRTVIIVHGKGDRSEEKAKMKSHVAHWLKELEPVLAYHSTQKHHGGTGALYVLIKKSKRTKQQNREKYNR